MAITKMFLDRQAKGKIFSFGTSSASEEGLLTVEKGTQPVSYVSFINKGSAQIDGNLVVGGNLTINGTIDTQSQTNTAVVDKTWTLNSGGTTAGSTGSGLLIEGDSTTVIGQIAFDNSIPTKFKVGDGTTNHDIVSTQHTQTIINKTMNATDNIITDTSTAAGDLFKSNGTKFVRFARGAANQLLRVNAAGTDLEWFTAPTSKEFRATAVTGTQDGSNKTFAIASSVTADSEQIFYNGALLTPGATNDYVLTGTALVFQSNFLAPLATDVIRAYGSY